jgi:hypothetical protein
MTEHRRARSGELPRGCLSGAKPVLAVLTSHPTGLNGFDFGIGSTEIAPNQRSRERRNEPAICSGSVTAETHTTDSSSCQTTIGWHVWR